MGHCRDRSHGWRGQAQAGAELERLTNPTCAWHVAPLALSAKCTLLPSVFVVSPANPSSRTSGIISSSFCPYWSSPFNPITRTAILNVRLNDVPGFHLFLRFAEEITDPLAAPAAVHSERCTEKLFWR